MKQQIGAAIARYTVKNESLETLQRIKRLKQQSRALDEQARNEQKALLEGLGIAKGDNADIVDGNGRLVATWKTSHRAEHVVKACDVSKLTIKTS